MEKLEDDISHFHTFRTSDSAENMRDGDTIEVNAKEYRAMRREWRRRYGNRRSAGAIPEDHYEE